jgi:hypothetical protein
VRKLAQINIGEEFKIGLGRSIIDLFRPKTDPSAKPTLGYFISSILPNVYVLAGIILFLLLFGGGLMVIVGGGQQNPEKTAQGSKAITAAVAGFLIIFASYWIIQIIERITGLKIFGV